MSGRREEETADSGASHPMGTPAGPTLPIAPGGSDATSERRQPTSSELTAEVIRISRLVQDLTVGFTELRGYVERGFRHTEERINRSRAAENEIRTELQSDRTTSMPDLMPRDVKPSKVPNISSTVTDDLRNWFRHARGYLKYYGVNPEESRSVFWASGHLEGPLSKWWHSRVALSGDDVGGGYTGITAMEASIIQEFCGRTPAKQARLNLDKARQKTTVQKYANYFREQLLELPHRTEEDNVHDFERGLRQSIRKEVALKNPKTLADAIQAALSVEAAEREVEASGRLNYMAENSDDEDCEDGREDASVDNDSATNPEQALYMARRLTADEVEKYKKEGKCFICQEKGHIASKCPKRKNKKTTFKKKSGN